MKLLRLSILGFNVLAAPAFAEPAEDESARADIIVTAPKLNGSVEGDIAPDTVLDEATVQSYGASNASDLLAALSVQTRSGRGRGSGPPVVLVNGRRVSGFAEIRDLPSEAIRRVDILPEDVAIRFGFNAEQRVINFILKEDFAAITGEIEYGGPTQGGRGETELQATLLKLSKKGRLNLSVQYDRDGAVLESERDILSAGPDLTAFRTLLPSNEAISLNSVYNRAFSDDLSGTLNLKYDSASTRSLFGLPTAGTDPLERDVRTQNIGAGATLEGGLGKWSWTATGNHDRTNIRTLTDQTSGAARDTAQSRFVTSNASLSLNGALARLPAGPVTLNVRAGFDKRRVHGRNIRDGIERRSLVRRSEANIRASLDIPLASRRRGVGAPLGDLSVNLNGGYRRLSGFSAIMAYGYGLNWSPLKGLSLLTSITVEEAAPTPQQLGDPAIATPNVLVFDFARGQTALVTQTTGGNPGLRAEERRDVKVSLTYSPPKLEALTLSASYFRNRSRDPISSFPAFTALTEAAFPVRIVRDASGQLRSVDVRSVNFLASRADQMRWGLSFSKEFGPKPTQGNGAPPEMRRGPPPGVGQGGGPGGGRGGGFGRFGGGQGSRWSVSLFHTLRFRDEIQTAPGLPVLDLLNGDATGQSGGSARHAFDLEGGIFHHGLGMRVIGAYQGPTTVSGGGLSQDLRFGSLTTLNLRFFLNFEQRKKVVDKVQFLKGSRIALRINNLFNEVQQVRDASGTTPLRYQRGFLDPLGRTVEVSFRKIF